MKKILAILSVFICVHLWTIPFSAQSQKFEPSEKSWKFADKQLKKMTLEEKVGSLIHVGINARFTNVDSEFYQDIRRQVVENKVGGVLFFGAPVYDTAVLINRLQAEAKTPLLISADAETGIGMRFENTTIFPWAMAVGATGNPEFARKIGVITGREARAMGIHHVYAPVVDVNNNANNPVINVRSYGENPEDVGRFGAAMTEGIQSSNAIATVKHFPGHGDTAVDSHSGLPIIDLPRERFDKVELVPFRKAIEAGVASVMIAHISLPQFDNEQILPLKNPVLPVYSESVELPQDTATIPATLSKKVQTDLLRNQLGFKGLIVSDAMDMSGLTLYIGQEEAGVRAIEAGTDLLEKPANPDVMIRGIINAVKSGRLTEDRINQSARKLLAWKHNFGLFKQKITPIDQIDKIVSSKEVRELADEVGKQAITLVKDEGKNLPLSKDKKIFVLAITNGPDIAFVSNTLTRTLRQNGYKFEFAALDERSTETEQNWAFERAKNADVVVAALYGRVRSGARNSGVLPTAGANVLQKILASDKPLINLSFGNPYLILSYPQMKTYVVSYGDMLSLQKATANAITGNQDFYGKLPITIGNYPRGTGLTLGARAASLPRLQQSEEANASN
jgi:beta-glucosidase-like glycosyl hydrolase